SNWIDDCGIWQTLPVIGDELVNAHLLISTGILVNLLAVGEVHQRPADLHEVGGQDVLALPGNQGDVRRPWLSRMGNAHHVADLVDRLVPYLDGEVDVDL